MDESLKGKMLKTMLRFMVILLVACLLGAGIYGIVQSNSTSLGAGNVFTGPGDGGNAPALASSGAAPDATASQNLQDRDHGSEDGFASSGAITGILRNIGVIALVTLVVASAQKLLSWVGRRRRPSPAQWDRII